MMLSPMVLAKCSGMYLLKVGFNRDCVVTDHPVLLVYRFDILLKMKFSSYKSRWFPYIVLVVWSFLVSGTQTFSGFRKGRSGH